MLTPTAAATPDGVSVHANEDLAHARRRVTVTGDMRALRVEALAVGPLTVAGASLTVNVNTRRLCSALRAWLSRAAQG